VNTPVATATGSAGASARHSDRALRAALWLIQVALSTVFAITGWLKLVKSGAALTAMVNWTTDVPIPLVRVIGVCELLGAIGLVLPAATRIRPELTPAAATGLTTVMALAFAFHLYRGDTRLLVIPLILAVLSCSVAWFRFRRVPIAPRGRTP
jgi:uncharacterized membrane protein YphA (DoxX/SURF4 family)